MSIWPKLREGSINVFHVIIDWGNKVKPATRLKRAEARARRIAQDERRDLAKSQPRMWSIERHPTEEDLEEDDPIPKPYVRKYQYDYLLEMFEDDEIRGIVRRMVVGASGRLTYEKLQATARTIWNTNQQWKDSPNWKDDFIVELRSRHPECFDGRAPNPRERRRSSGKQQPAGCAGLLIVGAILGAGIIIFLKILSTGYSCNLASTLGITS